MPSAAMIARRRQTFLALGGCLALYGLLLFGAAALERAIAPQGVALLAVNLLPMIGVIAVVGVSLRSLRLMDEMERRITLESAALAFIGTLLASFAWGFAEGAGMPRLTAFAVSPVMISLYLAGQVLLRLRYR